MPYLLSSAHEVTHDKSAGRAAVLNPREGDQAAVGTDADFVAIVTNRGRPPASGTTHVLSGSGRLRPSSMPCSTRKARNCKGGLHVRLDRSRGFIGRSQRELPAREQDRSGRQPPERPPGRYA